jgi:hypothetical protein
MTQNYEKYCNQRRHLKGVNYDSKDHRDLKHVIQEGLQFLTQTKRLAYVKLFPIQI